MRNETRLLFNAYVSQIALLNGVDSATVKFSVAPVVEQKLEEKIQETSDFLSQINVVGVPAQQGEKVGVTVTRPLASRTNTGAGNRRTPGDPTDTTDDGGYHCRQTISITRSSTRSSMPGATSRNSRRCCATSS